MMKILKILSINIAIFTGMIASIELSFNIAKYIKDKFKDSESVNSNIIETISGDKLNQSSIKAAVEDVSKKSVGKYL